MVLKCYLRWFSIKYWQELNQNFVAAPRKQNNFSGPDLSYSLLYEEGYYILYKYIVVLLSGAAIAFCLQEGYNVFGYAF